MISGPTVDPLQGNFSLKTMTVQSGIGDSNHITYPTPMFNV